MNWWKGLHNSKHFLTWASAVNGFISISAFASLLVIPIETTRSSIALNIFVIATWIKTYKSIIKKKKKKHHKVVLFAKSKLNIKEVLISKRLINSSIRHDKFILINNVRQEYNEMKEEIKNLKT